MHRIRIRHITLVLGLAALSAVFASAQGVHLKIPLTFSDNSGHSATVYFGVDPSATNCIDPSLGEFELPSDRCGTSNLCAYFIDSRDQSEDCLGNGLLLDFRGFKFVVQADTYRIVISAQNYPLTVRWPSSLTSHYDSAAITDMFGGALAKANMLAIDSLVISDPFVSQLVIHTWDPKGFVDGVRDNRAMIPRLFTLYQNYPNPFNPATSIGYDLPRMSSVLVRIFDVLGNLVTTLVDDDQLPGHHVVEWNTSDLATGIYYCRLQSSGVTETKAMVLVR